MRVAATVPSTAAHEDRVRQALKVIRDPIGGLRKVVLARAVDVVGDHPLAIETVLMRLAAADPAAYTYLVRCWWVPAPSCWWTATANG